MNDSLQRSSPETATCSFPDCNCDRKAIDTFKCAAGLPDAKPGVAQSSKHPADEMIGQIEGRFPNWRSYRDLVDCIDCTLHALRGSVSDTSTDRPTIPNILIDSRGNDIYTPEELGLSPRLEPAGKQARGKNGNGAWFGVIDSHNDPEHYEYRTVYAVADSSPDRSSK